jgi:hypothetical protein
LGGKFFHKRVIETFANQVKIFLLKSFCFCNQGLWGNKFKDQLKTFSRTQNFCKASLEISWENSFSLYKGF